MRLGHERAAPRRRAGSPPSAVIQPIDARSERGVAHAGQPWPDGTVGTSNSASSQPGLGAQRREEDDLPDGLDLGQEHGEPVDAHAHAAGRGHAVLEGPDVVEVDVAGLGVAGRLGRGLVAEPGQLVDRVVQLAVGVGQLAAADDELEPLDQGRVVAVGLGQRRDLARVVDARTSGAIELGLDLLVVELA